MHCSAGDPEASSTAHRNHWRGRGSGGGQDGGDDATSASFQGGGKIMGGVQAFVLYVTLLPSLVAGQDMECDGRYVKSSAETVATFNGLAGDVATFVAIVRASHLHTFSSPSSS